MRTETELSEHETAFINSFVLRDRRERYRSQLASRKKRGQFLDRLNHRFLDDIDPRFVAVSPSHPLPSSHEHCYVIASEDRYDSTTVAARDADTVLRGALFGILVSYIPGKLLAYKDEAPASIIWLCKE